MKGRQPETGSHGVSPDCSCGSSPQTRHPECGQGLWTSSRQPRSSRQQPPPRPAVTELSGPPPTADQTQDTCLPEGAVLGPLPLRVNDANPFKKTQVFLPQTPRMKEPIDPGPAGTLSSPAARWRAVQTAGPSTWPFLRWPGARWMGSIVLGLAGWKAPREKHTAVWIFPGDVHRVRGWRGWAVAGRKATEVFWSCCHCTRPEPHGLRVQFIHLNVSGR